MPYLHVVEDARLLEVELDIHAALPQGISAPAHVVVAGPDPQLLGLDEVVSSQDSITELTQASKLHPAHTALQGLTRAQSFLFNHVFLL